MTEIAAWLQDGNLLFNVVQDTGNDANHCFAIDIVGKCVIYRTPLKLKPQQSSVKSGEHGATNSWDRQPMIWLANGSGKQSSPHPILILTSSSPNPHLILILILPQKRES